MRTWTGWPSPPARRPQEATATGLGAVALRVAGSWREPRPAVRLAGLLAVRGPAGAGRAGGRGDPRAVPPVGQPRAGNHAGLAAGGGVMDGLRRPIEALTTSKVRAYCTDTLRTQSEISNESPHADDRAVIPRRRRAPTGGEVPDVPVSTLPKSPSPRRPQLRVCPAVPSCGPARPARPRPSPVPRSARWLASPAHAVRPDIGVSAFAFPLTDVTLLAGPFQANMGRTLSYLAFLDINRMLHTFRLNVGLSSSATAMGGWETPTTELRGHSTGPPALGAGPGVRQHRRRRLQDQGRPDRHRAGPVPGPGERGRLQHRLPVGVPGELHRPRRGPAVGLGALLHPAQDHGRPARHAPAGRQRPGADRADRAWRPGSSSATTG